MQHTVNLRARGAMRECQRVWATRSISLVLESSVARITVPNGDEQLWRYGGSVQVKVQRKVNHELSYILISH